jgi:hypothetical protein
MTRLLRSLLIAALALGTTLGAAGAIAQPSRAFGALQMLAQLSPSELLARLRDGHAAVNEALKLRQARFEKWQTVKQARDASAAMVASLKAGGATGPGLQNALRGALALDEEAARTRSRLAEAEAEVASRGAELLALYDGALRLKRKEVLDLRADDPRRSKSVAAYRQLAQRRDSVRAALRPALQHDARGGASGPTSADLDVGAEDDVGTLLEKADLARDLEERFLRRARTIQKRILELEEQADLARRVGDLARDQRLFDEEARRLVAVGALRQVPGKSALEQGSGGGGDNLLAGAPADQNERADEPAAVVAPPPAPPPPADPSVSNDADLAPDDGASFEAAEPTVGAGRVSGSDAVGQAPAPGLGEQLLLGATDADVDALLASGRLSLRQLKALEKRLRAEAEAARKKGGDLRDEVRSRSRR